MRKLLGAVAALALASPAAQAATMYNLTYIIPQGDPQAVDYGYVQGTITTDGKIGALVASDILAWNLHVSVVGHDQDFSEADSHFRTSEGLPGYVPGLSATASDIFFDFAHQDGFQLDSNANPGGNCGSGPTFCVILSFTGFPTEGIATIQTDNTYPGWGTTIFMQPPPTDPVRLATEGRFVPTPTTPIPGSLLLFATALAAMVPLARRRKSVTA